ncbi:site-specific recombinase XerD [Defluviimonas denitrificans]|jgi:integrase|uniref:Site-specific recombinase XerD n=1 Tax=Albidovulum denitrificans TaxID=404881 RepID=A0A2S8SAS2_9RHOB|nr:site-specific integrase [Defluviimonas denitrificans]PQV57863.1 site-specific recombinase XerD [Defluviimonas denitrificans]
MVRKHNEENERIKRRYLLFLREAKRSDPATVDKVAEAILRFESGTGFRPFKRFHIEQAVKFKAQLAAAKNERTGAPLSKATIDGTLRAVKAFVLWLAGQPGYRSRIAYADAEYFNLNAKDVRIAHAQRDMPFPSMEQCRHAFSLMPEATPLERRDRALFAFLMLTGARDGAIASLRLRHIDLFQGCVYQDARDVKTKFAKTFTTWFFPVDAVYLQCFHDWVEYLRTDQLFGAADALFPKPLMGLKDGGFACLGLSRDTYGNAGRIRAVIKDAFTSAGLPPFGPHSFRKTLGILANEHCRTPEAFKAWSMNLGHENIATTLSAYCPVSTTRQGELIRGMA